MVSGKHRLVLGCVVWKGCFVVTVMTSPVSNTGIKTSVCRCWEFQFEVALLFYLYFKPMDDLFPLGGGTLDHATVTSACMPPELQSGLTVLMSNI